MRTDRGLIIEVGLLDPIDFRRLPQSALLGVPSRFIVYFK